MRPLLVVGGDIFVRTGSLYASFLLASAVLARIGAALARCAPDRVPAVGFLALVLDAVAIAGQVIVGRALGAGRAQDAWEASVRMLVWSLGIGLVIAVVMLGLIHVLLDAFTSDPRVLGRLHAIWPIHALMQPLNALAFALDGILIGGWGTRAFSVGDGVLGPGRIRPRRAHLAAAHWGIVGVCAGCSG